MDKLDPQYLSSVGFYKGPLDGGGFKLVLNRMPSIVELMELREYTFEQAVRWRSDVEELIAKGEIKRGYPIAVLNAQAKLKLG